MNKGLFEIILVFYFQNLFAMQFLKTTKQGTLYEIKIVLYLLQEYHQT